MSHEWTFEKRSQNNLSLSGIEMKKANKGTKK